MEEQYAKQIALLKERCVPAEFLEVLFGIHWPPVGDFSSDFNAWSQTRGKKASCAGGLLSRWEAETFLQDNRLLAHRWAAASLGMTPESLTAILPCLPKIGLRRGYEVYPGLIDEAIGDDVVRSLKGLRYRTFGTHDSFCELLHAALAAATGVKIEPLLCATSVEMGEYPILYAHHIDSITLEPLSIKHSVWLALGKPLNLSPDRVSKLFYIRHQSEMQPLIADRGEPEWIGVYERFLNNREAAVRG